MFKKIAKIISIITLLLATGVLLESHAAEQQATPPNFSVVEVSNLDASKRAEIKPLSELTTIEDCVHYTLVYQKVTPTTTSTSETPSTTSTTTTTVPTTTTAPTTTAEVPLTTVAPTTTTTTMASTTTEALTTSTTTTSKEEVTPVITTSTTTATTATSPVQVKQQLPETGTQKTLATIIAAIALILVAIIAIKNHKKKIILFFAISSGVLTLYQLHTTMAQAEVAPLAGTTPLTITKQDDVQLLGFIAEKDANCSISTTTATTETEETTTTTTTIEKAKVTVNYWIVDKADFEALKETDVYKKVTQTLKPFSFYGPPPAGVRPNATPDPQTYTYQKGDKEVSITQKPLSEDGRLLSTLYDEFVVNETPAGKLKLYDTIYQEYALNDTYKTYRVDIPEYKLATLKESSAPVSGKVDRKDGIVIDYVYIPREYPVPPHAAPQ